MDIHAIYLRYRFWILDFLKGSPIGKPYREIKALDKLSFANGSNKRELKLKKLLTFAQTNTIFYKNIKSYNLTDYPVINKQTLINHHKEIEVSKEVIPGQKGNIYIQKTSGSTGIPLEIPQDSLKRKVSSQKMAID